MLDRLREWKRTHDWSAIAIYVAMFLVLIYVVNDVGGFIETPADRKIERSITLHIKQDRARHAQQASPNDTKPVNGRAENSTRHSAATAAGSTGGGSSTGVSSPPSTTAPSPGGGGGGSGGGAPPSGGTNPPAAPGLDDTVNQTLDDVLDGVCNVTNPVTGVCINP